MKKKSHHPGELWAEAQREVNTEGLFAESPGLGGDRCVFLYPAEEIAKL